MQTSSTVKLKNGFAKPIWAGNPFVYPKAVEHWPESLVLGDWLSLADANGHIIGHGVYNPNSLYRLRMLSYSTNNLEATLRSRIQEAIALRRLQNLPNPQTNAYRLINSEGDGLSGITIDIFNTHAVVAITGAWALVHRELLDRLLREALPEMTFIWRPQVKALQQEGWREAFTPIEENQEDILISENGISYKINPYQGQKTGFYCDQRDNRLLVQAYAKDRHVLDLCCFSGGFSLHAAKGGAASVTGIDSSAPAIASAKVNAELNHFSQIQFKESDALDALIGSKTDFVILDPPKLAPTQKHLHRALKHYIQLNEAALRALPSNGLLLTCSCSQAVSLEDLQQVLRQAGLNAGKQLQILKVAGASADHPVHLAFPEGQYLKALLVRVI